MLCTLSGLAVSAHADQDLTLELPPSQAAQEIRATEKARALTARATAAPRSSRSTRSQFTTTRGNLPSRGGRFTRVVGKLGQLDQQTAILRSPRAGARVLITAPAGTYVAVRDSRDDWYGVLMADGSTGWLRSENLKTLDYQVTANSSANLTGARASDYAGDTAMLTSSQESILNEAYKYLGVKYVWGGNGYGGIDCSGFVKNVFGACGYSLPRTATEQMAYGIAVAPEQLQAGDRLYFGHKKDGWGVTHTGIYIGNGYFIHSSSSRKGVAVSNLSEAMFARIFVCARR